MKVAIISKYWINSQGGGIKNYIINLKNELEKNDIKVSILFKDGLDNSNFKIEGGKIFFPIRAFLILIKLKPDAVCSQGTWYTLLSGVLYKKIFGCKLIDTFRSEPERELPFIIRDFYQFMINQCDHVTFVSKGLEEVCKEKYNLNFDNAIITYPGVRTKIVTVEEINIFKNKYNISEDSPILLIQSFTANKIKAEGVKLTIRAVRELIIKYPNIKLILTREGKYCQELKDYIFTEKLHNNVIFTGDIENPFIPLMVCDIFLFPWLGKSGVGNALLEAMCLGKPIIGTSVNGKGINEVITHNENGILVEPNSTQLAEKIDFLLANNEFANSIALNAKILAEKEFTWDKCAKIYIRLFTE